METLEILSDRAALAEIRKAEREMTDGDVFDEEHVRATLTKRRA